MSDLLPLEQPSALAQAFVEVLTDWLKPAEMRVVRRRNQMNLLAGNGCCASHDFCDANMAMVEAFEEFGLATPGDEGCEDGTPAHEAACDLWNRAWGIAFNGDLQP